MSELLFTQEELHRRVGRVQRTLEHARKRITIPEGPRSGGVKLPTKRDRDRDDLSTLLLHCAKIAEGRVVLFNNKSRGAPTEMRCPREMIAGYSCILDHCALCGGVGLVAVSVLVEHYARIARELAELGAYVKRRR